jgi:hypothetical protein
MKTPSTSSSSLVARAAIFALLSIASISFAADAAPSDRKANAPTQPMSEQAAKLPIQSSFKKEKSGENKGLYTLTLKNTSATPLTVSVTVDESVNMHARPKTRTLSPSVIEPGKTLKVDALAAQDKVTATADGFAPLQLVVP